jgi:site-specific recombinase XerD
MDTKKLGIEKKFIDMMSLKNMSDATKRSYSNHLERFLALKKNKHVSILSSQDVNDYLLHMVSNKAGSSNLNQAINSIRFLFKYVLNRKIKGYLVVRPKKEKTSPVLLSNEEISAIFSACNNKKHLAILYLLYGAGLRISEVINLKISDIDSKCMLIHIKSGKGKKDRQVMLDESVLKVLREYFIEFKPKNYLFNGQFDDDYSTGSIQKFVKKYARLAGVTKKVHPHLFRHNFATGVLESGGSLYDAQIMLGHQDPRTTANVYAHLSSKYLSSIKSPIRNLASRV